MPDDRPEVNKRKVAVAEVTRKLLVVEVTNELRRADREEWFINETQAGSIIHASEPTMFSHPICKVHELPSAEELDGMESEIHPRRGSYLKHDKLKRIRAEADELEKNAKNN